MCCLPLPLPVINVLPPFAIACLPMFCSASDTELHVSPLACCHALQHCTVHIFALSCHSRIVYIPCTLYRPTDLLSTHSVTLSGVCLILGHAVSCCVMLLCHFHQSLLVTLNSSCTQGALPSLTMLMPWKSICIWCPQTLMAMARYSRPSPPPPHKHKLSYSY